MRPIFLFRACRIKLLRYVTTEHTLGYTVLCSYRQNRKFCSVNLSFADSFGHVLRSLLQSQANQSVRSMFLQRSLFRFCFIFGNSISYGIHC